jgi:hypothetical protein
MTKIPNNCLWQYVEKKHLDDNNEISKVEWNEFISMYESTFAESVSQTANDLFEEYKTNYLKRKEVA